MSFHFGHYRPWSSGLMALMALSDAWRRCQSGFCMSLIGRLFWTRLYNKVAIATGGGRATVNKLELQLFHLLPLELQEIRVYRLPNSCFWLGKYNRYFPRDLGSGTKNERYLDCSARSNTSRHGAASSGLWRLHSLGADTNSAVGRYEFANSWHFAPRNKGITTCHRAYPGLSCFLRS